MKYKNLLGIISVLLVFLVIYCISKFYLKTYDRFDDSNDIIGTLSNPVNASPTGENKFIQINELVYPSTASCTIELLFNYINDGIIINFVSNMNNPDSGYHTPLLYVKNNELIMGIYSTYLGRIYTVSININTGINYVQLKIDTQNNPTNITIQSSQTNIRYGQNSGIIFPEYNGMSNAYLMIGGNMTDPWQIQQGGFTGIIYGLNVWRPKTLTWGQSTSLYNMYLNMTNQQPPTTTMVPPTTTMVPPTTTMVPPTTTMVPPTTTMVPPTTTMAPPSSTMAPPTSTMAPPSSTMAPPSSTMAPPSSTTAPPSSTMVPPTSTMAPPSSTNVGITTGITTSSTSPYTSITSGITTTSTNPLFPTFPQIPTFPIIPIPPRLPILPEIPALPRFPEIPNASPALIADLINKGVNINDLLTTDGIARSNIYQGPSTNIAQNRFSGTSNIYSPFLFYEKGTTEKFLDSHDKSIKY